MVVAHVTEKSDVIFVAHTLKGQVSCSRQAKMTHRPCPSASDRLYVCVGETMVTT